jgi:hypothetical protein
MAVLINPNNVKVVAQNGTVTLALQIELNINLNANGSFASNDIKGSVTSAKVAETQQEEDKESSAWLVPDFSSKEKIKFGK